MDWIKFLVSGVITALVTGDDFALAGNVDAIEIDLGYDLLQETIQRNTVLDIVMPD